MLATAHKEQIRWRLGQLLDRAFKERVQWQLVLVLDLQDKVELH